MTTLYHNPRCSKSRTALELLEGQGIEFEVIEYLKSPPHEADLRKIIKMLGIKPHQLVRTGEKLYQELGLSERQLSDAEWITTLATYPQLIERPIVVHNGRAAIGRPTEEITELFEN